MKIILVNPNRYKNPPVIPIGLEYLATMLEKNNHTVKIVDLCFSDNTNADIDNCFNEFDSDIVGITVRNVDPSIYGRNDFFIDEIKNIATYIKNKYKKPIILGGSGFSIMPDEILECVGADYGVYGYGENAILKLLSDIENRKIDYKIINGFELGIDRGVFHTRCRHFDYKKYFEADGIAGFETQKGCNGDCIFCSEANRKIIHKNIKNVIYEIKTIADFGYNKFHLCDSEFNLELKFCENFLNELIKEKIDIKWTLYIKPVPFNKKFFELLKKSGANLITMSVDSYKFTDSKSPYSDENLKEIVKYTKSYEIKLAIDLLMGFPFETKDSIENAITFFKKNRPDKVGISYAIRIYPHTEIERIVKKNGQLKKYLYGNLSNNYINPAYFKCLSLDDINGFVDGDEIFQIEGTQKTVNYQRF